MTAVLAAVAAFLWLVIRILLTLLGVVLALVLLLVLIPVSVRLGYSQQKGFSARVRVMGIPLRAWPLPGWLEKRLHASEEDVPSQPAPPESAPRPASGSEPSQPAAPAAPTPRTPAPAAAPTAQKNAAPSKAAAPARSQPESSAAAAQPSKEVSPSRQKQEQQLHSGTEKLLALLRTVRGGLRLLFKGIWVTVWIRWPIQAEDAARTALLYGKANAWIGGAAAVLAHLFQFRLRQLELAPDFLGDKQGRGEVSCRITASLPVLAAAAVWTLVQLKKQKVF